MMFTLENTWSPPTAVALWGNDSSDEEIDTEEIRWLKQTYLWGTNNEEDADHACSTINEENTSQNGIRKGVYRPSRHICYHTPNKGCAEDAGIGNLPRRQRYRHNKRKKRKEGLPPINVKQGKPATPQKEYQDMNGTSVRLPSLAALSPESPIESESHDKKNPLQVLKFKRDKKYHYPNVDEKVPRTSQRSFGINEGINSPVEATAVPLHEKNYKKELVSSEDVILHISSQETTNGSSFQTTNSANKRTANSVADSNKQVKVKHGPIKGLFKDIYLKTQSSASNEIKRSNENTHKSVQSDDKSSQLKKNQNLEMHASKLSDTNKAQIVSSHFSRQNKNSGERIRNSSSCETNVAPKLSYSQRFKNVKNKFIFRNGVLSHLRFDEEDESDVDEESGSSSFDDSDSDDDSGDESVQSSGSGRHSSVSSDNVNDSLSEDEHETKTKKKSTFKYTMRSFNNFSYRKPPERVKLETSTITVSKKTVKKNVAKSVRWAVKLVKIRYFQRDARSSASDSN